MLQNFKFVFILNEKQDKIIANILDEKLSAAATIMKY